MGRGEIDISSTHKLYLVTRIWTTATAVCPMVTQAAAPATHKQNLGLAEKGQIPAVGFRNGIPMNRRTRRVRLD